MAALLSIYITAGPQVAFPSLFIFYILVTLPLSRAHFSPIPTPKAVTPCRRMQSIHMETCPKCASIQGMFAFHHVLLQLALPYYNQRTMRSWQVPENSRNT